MKEQEQQTLNRKQLDILNMIFDSVEHYLSPKEVVRFRIRRKTVHHCIIEAVLTNKKVTTVRGLPELPIDDCMPVIDNLNQVMQQYHAANFKEGETNE